MSNPQTKDAKEKKVRVFNLAKDLNVESKLLLDFCKELGFSEIKNQLNGLEPEQAEALKERLKKGPAKTATAPLPTPGLTPKSIIPPPAKLDKPIQTLPKPVPKPLPKPVEPAPVVAAPAASASSLTAQIPAQPAAPTHIPAPTPPPSAVAETPSRPIQPTPSTPPTATPVHAPSPAPTPGVPPRNVIPPLVGGGIRNLNAGRPATLSPRPPASNAPVASASAPTPPVAPTPVVAAPVAATPDAPSPVAATPDAPSPVAATPSAAAQPTQPAQPLVVSAAPSSVPPLRASNLPRSRPRS